MIGVIGSGLVMLLREDASCSSIPGFMAPWQTIGTTTMRRGRGPGGHRRRAREHARRRELSQRQRRLGMIIGMRINAEHGARRHAGVGHRPVLPRQVRRAAELQTDAVIDTPTARDVLFWVMWPATGMLVAGGLTALVLRWRLLVGTFRSLRDGQDR